MLLSLKVNNYALIEELYIEFHKGLNIITGETGAGKSILLGALGLILGKRADSNVLSNTRKKCVVEAEFNVADYDIEQLFVKNDIDFEPHTIIRREILVSGKSRAFVNDTPVNLTVLQDVSLKLVDIHSQHQNLLLNKQDFLLNIVDRYCKHDNLLNEYSRAFMEYKALKRDYDSSLTEFEAIRSEMDYLTYQVEELSEAKLKEGEVGAIELELAQVENSAEIKSAMHTSNQLIAEENGILDKVNSIITTFNKVEKVYPLVIEFKKRLDSIRIELKELNSDIVSAFEEKEFDPEMHEELKSRLDLLYGLFRKYKVENETELIDKLSELEERLSIGIDGEYELEKLKGKLDNSESRVKKIAAAISKNRIKASPEIQKKVEGLLVDLGIPHGKLKIQREGQEITYNGIDSVNFLFSANKNHPLNEVSKIASGGELSRLMLSIKALLSSTNGMPTIILDEIDTGVSGEIANKVGNIIRSMGDGMQVINITHLPQVASKASAHYKVYKDHQSSQTRTLVKKLNDEERLEEIAKMLSGDEITQASLENARVLLGR